MQSSALLKLIYLVSPALPVGAYAYSQGQEYAVDAGWLKTNNELENWIQSLMENALVNLDLPCLYRLYTAWNNKNYERVTYWNQYVLASRETSELLLEDEQMGQALSRLLDSIDENYNEELLLEIFQENEISFISLFAYCGVLWSIPINELMYGFVAAWLENQVAAATKAIPLGQTQAQKIILNQHDSIPACIKQAQNISDEDIGLSLPGLAIASSKHERQYSRLFRS